MEIPEMIRDELVAAGVDPAAITLVPSESASVQTALEMARPNDLVLVFCEAITATWKQIIYFRPAEAPAPPAPERKLAAAGFEVPPGWRLVSDDRGVRIAPEA
jgi:cyanophycin synthetase